MAKLRRATVGFLPLQGTMALRSAPRLIALAFAVFLHLPTSAASQSWRPVKVNRDAEGWPHHFLVWNGSGYEPRVLFGYASIDFGTENLTALNAKLQRLADNKANFIRMWMRPSDGRYAFFYDAARGKVDLDTWNPEFFSRLDTILGLAESKGLAIEVMLWDRTSGWRGSPLLPPTTWDTCWLGDEELCKNVHHPQNHYRSTSGDEPIPGLSFQEGRIEDNRWYATYNAAWMDYQRRYVDRVMVEVRKHNNVAVEIINEAPDSDAATQWRRVTHRWFRGRYPDVLLQSEAVGSIQGSADIAMRAFGRDEPGMIDMVSTHGEWTYDLAQSKYYGFKGVLPGINECGPRCLDVSDPTDVRRIMYGITLGGGAAYIENLLDGASVGGVVTNELFRFFYPPTDRPEFWAMRPRRNLVRDNDGHKYVLAKDDTSEILIFVDNEATTAEFHVNGFGSYRYRWFVPNGAASSWGGWMEASSWDFTPPAVERGLQIQRVADGPGNLRASVVGFRVDLTWNHFGSGVVEYRIQHKDSPDDEWPPAIDRVPVDQTTYSHSVREPPGMADEHFYRVRAWNGSGGPFSNEVRVVVYREAPNIPPVLTGPSGCVSTLRPTFTWQAVPRATGYRLLVAPDGTDDFFIDVYPTGTSYTPSFDLTPGRRYRFKVRGTNNIGVGPWGGDMYFTPFCAPETPPTPIAPMGCSVLRPTFAWTAVAGATNYRLLVTKDVPEIFFIDVFPTGTTYTSPVDLEASVLYRWKVRAISSGAPGPYSDIIFFVPECAAPAVTAVSPRAGPQGGGTRITITGTGFRTGARVVIGGVSGTGVTVVNATTITATVGASVPGVGHVVVSYPGGPSGTLPNGYTYLAPTVFADDPLVAQVTVVKAQHVSELRQAVNVLRTAAGLSAASWTDPTLGSGTTLIRAVHVQELRTRLNEALVALGYATAPYTDPTLTPGSTVIRKVHMEELRQRVKSVTG